MIIDLPCMAPRRPDPNTVVTTEPKPGDRVTMEFLQQSRQNRDEEQKKILKDLVVVSIRGSPPLRVMLTQPANDAFVKATFVDQHDCATEMEHFRKEEVFIISGGGTSEVVAQCRAASRQQSAGSPVNTPSEPANATVAAFGGLPGAQATIRSVLILKEGGTLRRECSNGRLGL